MVDDGAPYSGVGLKELRVLANYITPTWDGTLEPILDSIAARPFWKYGKGQHTSASVVLWVFAGVHKKHQTHNHKRPSRGNKCLGNLCGDKGVAW